VEAGCDRSRRDRRRRGAQRTDDGVAGGDEERSAKQPADPATSWGEAIAWTAATGLVVGVARMLASRGAAAGWQKATGTLPPGLQEVV
jgi:hypothetical protein